MTTLQTLQSKILADGVIDDAEVELLRRELYIDNQIDKEDVEFLMELRSEARSVCPAFEELFFQALKDNVLQDGSIEGEEAHWLRAMLFADGKIDDREKKFLRDLKREARQTSPEFQILYGECMR